MTVLLGNPTPITEDLDQDQDTYTVLAIDEDTGMLASPMRVLSGTAAYRQTIGCMLKFVRGEWFLDTRIGLPYYEEIWGKKGKPEILIASIFRDALRLAPGVKFIVRCVAAYPTEASERAARVIYVSWEVVLHNGARIAETRKPYIIRK